MALIDDRGGFFAQSDQPVTDDTIEIPGRPVHPVLAVVLVLVALLAAGGFAVIAAGGFGNVGNAIAQTIAAQTGSGSDLDSTSVQSIGQSGLATLPAATPREHQATRVVPLVKGYVHTWYTPKVGGNLLIRPDATATVTWSCAQTTQCTAKMKFTHRGDQSLVGVVQSESGVPFTYGTTVTLTGDPSSGMITIRVPGGDTPSACVDRNDPCNVPSPIG